MFEKFDIKIGIRVYWWTIHIPTAGSSLNDYGVTFTVSHKGRGKVYRLTGMFLKLFRLFCKSLKK